MKTPLHIRIIVILLAVLLPGAGLAGWLFVEQSLENNFQTFIQAQSKLDIEYSEMKVNPLKRNITLFQPKILYNSNIEIKAEEMVFQELVITNNFPIKMTLSVSRMDIRKFFPSLELTRKIELSGTRLSGINGKLRYEYLPDEYMLDMSMLKLENRDMGLFCSELVLSNLNIGYISSLENPFVLAAALMGIRIDYFQAGYEDYGIIKKLSEFKESKGINEDSPAIGQGDPGSWKTILDDYIAAKDNNPVDKFLRGQDPLTIKINPQRPVPLSAILASHSPEDAMKLLNLRCSNQRPDFCLATGSR